MLMILSVAAIAVVGGILWWRKKVRDDGKGLPGASPADIKRLEQMRRKNPAEVARIEAEADALVAEFSQDKLSKK